MKGSILSFDQAAGSGLIRADDGKRYQFSGQNWSDRTSAPFPGVLVDFETSGEMARDIIVLRTGNAAGTAAMPNADDAASNGNLLGGLSIAGGVLGFVPGFGFIFSVAGLVLGILARKQAKSTANGTGATLGAIGIALSCIVFVIEIVVGIFLGAVLFGVGSGKLW